MKTLLAIGVALAASTPVFSDTPAATLTPQTAQNVPGGAGHFDYMQPDSAHNRIYASHPETGFLTIVDLKTNKVSEVQTPGAVNGIAVDKADNLLLAAGGGQHVVFLDGDTLTTVGNITLPQPADDIVLDRTSDQLYVDADDTPLVTVIDVKTRKIVTTITLGGAPEFIVYDPATDLIYQNIKSTDSIQVIDPKTNTVTATWPTAPATGPHGLALDRATGRLFSAGRNGLLAVVDVTTGKVITTVPIAKGVDQIAFDPKSKRIYAAAGKAGVISVVQETADGATSLGDFPSAAGAHTLAIDPATGNVWVSYATATQSFVQAFAP